MKQKKLSDAMNPNRILKNSEPRTELRRAQDIRGIHGQRVHYKLSVAVQPNSGLSYLITEVS